MCETENRWRDFEFRSRAFSSKVGPVCDLCSPRVSREHEISVAQVGSLTPTAYPVNRNTQNTQIRHSARICFSPLTP